LKRLLLVALLLPIAAHADEYTLTIKDHKFQPAEFTIPSGTKIRLSIENQDATPEEFDSYALNREKVITGHGTATIFIGPLEAGHYPYTGEFHSATAHGVIIAQ
jgi:plastocyanin